MNSADVELSNYIQSLIGIIYDRLLGPFILIMRWTDKNNDGFYKGKNKGFIFTISHARDYEAFYVVASHGKKDIRLNTLWIKKVFAAFELAEKFCETFDYRKYKCIGDNT